MAKEFITLHCHTTFSFRDAYGLPSQHAARAASIGNSALAITDHGSISGWVRHNKACRDVGIKPLFGCEFYMVEDLGGEPEIRKHRDHLTVIARNQEGLRSIMALLSVAWENFYYKPIIDYRTLEAHSDGLLVLSGCMYGKYAQAVWSRNDEDEASRTIKWFQGIFGDAFFLETQPFALNECHQTATAAINHGIELGVPVTLTTDAHYPAPEDEEGRNLLLRVTPGWTPDTKTSPLWQYSRKEAFRSIRTQWPKAPKNILSELLDNSLVAANMCEDMDLPQAEPIHYTPVEFDNVHDEFLACVKRGWKRRDLHLLSGEEHELYKKRLYREVRMIREKGFEDYLMVVADVITWAKGENIIVGPARGSSSGSLVCWCLGITEVDPVRWGLLFERFIDVNRMDPPDIDTDFEDARRDEIHAYLRDKYGDDHFAQLCTFAQYKPRSALDDVAKAFRIPKTSVETIKGFVIERSSADARASHCLEDTIEAFPAAKNVIEEYPDLRKATLLEGQFRQFSRHACGVIIGENPLQNHAAIIRSDDGSPMICYEGYDAGALGFLKLDVLGLRSLSIIAEILRKIGKDIDWLYGLPFDDELTYKGFQRGDLTGVFQFTGQSTMSVCKQMPPNHFMELSDINALSRPGPLHSGSTTLYIARRNGEQIVDKIHPVYDEITKDTYGVIVYQEQIMEIARNVAGMSWEFVSVFRKQISKKLGVEGFKKWEEMFIMGCAETSCMDEETARPIWDNICTHGSWSFNKSHAVAYALISYLMMYLKAHYPMEFDWANLVTLTDKQKQTYVLRDYINKGGKVLPVHINKSGATWTIDGDALRPGFSEIKGIGEAIAGAIIEGQPYANKEDFLERVNKRRVHKGIQALLFDGGMFSPDGEPQDSKIVDVYGLLHMKDVINNLPVTHRIAELGWGKEHYCRVAGRIIELNVRDVFEVAWSKRGETLDPTTMHKPELAAFVNITLEDDTDSIYATFDRFVYPRVRDIIASEENEKDDIFIIKGAKTKGFRKVYAKTIENVSLAEREAKKIREEVYDAEREKRSSGGKVHRRRGGKSKRK